MPQLSKVDTAVGECCHCEKEIFDNQDYIYDKEGGVMFCDDNCLAEFIRRYPREFIDLLLNFNLFELIKAS